MPEPQDEFRVNTPGVATPGTAAGFMPAIIDDIVPPRYPDDGEVGCTLAIYRPGSLVPIEGLSRIEIPRGAILCYVLPHEAVHMRPAINEMKRQLQAKVRQEMERRGAMGRRG
jgi:hypothetical protein